MGSCLCKFIGSNTWICITDGCRYKFNRLNKYAYKGVRFTDFFKNTIITAHHYPNLTRAANNVSTNGYGIKWYIHNRQRCQTIRNILRYN